MPAFHVVAGIAICTPHCPGFDKATSADYDKTTKIAGNESMELQKPGSEVVYLS